MSGPGFFYGDQDPADMRRMQMAQALMGNSADPRQQFSGVANAGKSLMGAMQMRSVMDKRDPLAPVVSTAPKIGGGVEGWGRRNLPGLFSFGGG